VSYSNDCATTESYTIPLLESSYGNISSCSWPNHSSDVVKWSSRGTASKCITYDASYVLGPVGQVLCLESQFHSLETCVLDWITVRATNAAHWLARLRTATTPNALQRTHHCLVGRQWNKTPQSFLSTWHTSLCPVLDCQTEAPMTYDDTPILLWPTNASITTMLLSTSATRQPSLHLYTSWP